MKSRVIFICYFLCFAYFSFLFRGMWLQFFPDERLISAKKRNFEKVIKLKPRRGTIYDRHGRELAISIASHSLFADPHLIKNPGSVSRKLSRLLKISFRSVYKKIRNNKRRFVWLKRHITPQEWNTIRSWKIPGLAFLEEPKRVYPNGSLLAQTLGFVGRDGHGLEGLELSHNDLLRGEEKKVLVQKDAMGRPLFSDTHTDLLNLRTNGADIYLTIDSDLQFFFEKELKKTVQKYQAKSALGIIMNPHTGEILALAHVPGFDLNRPFHGKTYLFRNRAVTDAFEPGSTFKPFVVASALKKHIPPARRYSHHHGKLVIAGHTINEAESHKVFKDLSLREILMHSSNIGVAQLALDIGEHFLYQSLQDFGFGHRLGIQFPGESAGIINKTPWTPLQLATIGFGHGISVTPLQMATAYGAIANGGVLYKPYLTQSVYYKDNGKWDFFKPAILKRAFPAKQAKILTVMLISAVSREGTGRRAQVKGFLTAGKTGTAQVVDPKKKGYIKNQYISSFAGFIPAQNPQFVIYLAVEQPQKAFYGSTVAAPVFSQVAGYAVRQAGLSPVLISEKNVLKTKNPLSISRHVSHVSDAYSPGTKPANPQKNPGFIGLSLREAYQYARQIKVQIQVSGSGLVVRTVPVAGHISPENRVVHIILK